MLSTRCAGPRGFAVPPLLLPETTALVNFVQAREHSAVRDVLPQHVFVRVDHMIVLTVSSLAGYVRALGFRGGMGCSSCILQR
jgi:hypothetical protein